MISLNTLREVAALSETALVLLAEGLAKKRDVEGFRLLFDMLRTDGFPGNTSKNDLSIGVSGDGPERNASLSDALVDLLQDPCVSTSLIDVFVDAYRAHGSNPEDVASVLLFKSASVHRQDIAEHLMEMGADTGCTIVSTTNDNFLSRPYHECLLHGNAEQAIAMVRNQPDAIVQTMLNHIALGRTAKGDSPAQYPEADMLVIHMAMETEGVPPGGLQRLLTAFDERLGRGASEPARLQLLQRYLGNATMRVMGVGWTIENVETILGGPVSDCSIFEKLRADPQHFLFSTTTANPLEALLKTAVQVQCAPILNEHKDALGNALLNDDAGGVSISDLFPFVPLEPFEAVHFRDTLNACLAARYPLNHDRHGTTLLHRLALSHVEAMENASHIENHTLSKLKILLDTGADPRLKNSSGLAADDAFLDDHKNRWNDMVNAHAARTSAHKMLDEISASSPTP